MSANRDIFDIYNSLHELIKKKSHFSPPVVTKGTFYLRMVYVSWDECKEYFYPLPLLSDFQVPTILLFSSSFSSLFISRPLTSHAPTSLKVNFNIPKGGGGCELQKIGKFGPMELQNSAPKAPNFLKKQCFLTKKWAFLVKKHQI